MPALLVLGVYGALGLCSQHTLLANLTIGAEATTGLALRPVSSVLAGRQFRRAGAV